jgi:hypothetical protein
MLGRSAEQKERQNPEQVSGWRYPLFKKSTNLSLMQGLKF